MYFKTDLVSLKVKDNRQDSTLYVPPTGLEPATSFLTGKRALLAAPRGGVANGYGMVSEIRPSPSGLRIRTASFLYTIYIVR